MPQTTLVRMQSGRLVRLSAERLNAQAGEVAEIVEQPGEPADDEPLPVETVEELLQSLRDEVADLRDTVAEQKTDIEVLYTSVQAMQEAIAQLTADDEPDEPVDEAADFLDGDFE